MATAQSLLRWVWEGACAPLMRPLRRRVRARANQHPPPRVPPRPAQARALPSAYAPALADQTYP
jgi:hypothetical protein